MPAYIRRFSVNVRQAPRQPRYQFHDGQPQRCCEFVNRYRVIAVPSQQCHNASSTGSGVLRYINDGMLERAAPEDTRGLSVHQHTAQRRHMIQPVPEADRHHADAHSALEPDWLRVANPEHGSGRMLLNVNDAAANSPQHRPQRRARHPVGVERTV